MGDSVVGSTELLAEGSKKGITPRDQAEVVMSLTLEEIEALTVNAICITNTYFQAALQQAGSWKEAGDKVKETDQAVKEASISQRRHMEVELELLAAQEKMGKLQLELQKRRDTVIDS
ncbi:hypothetical protein AgCh_015902 [Apium graveolens]